MDCRTAVGQVMEGPDHNGVGYGGRGPQGDGYRTRGPLQRHHTIQNCDDAYVSGFSSESYAHTQTHTDTLAPTSTLHTHLDEEPIF